MGDGITAWRGQEGGRQTGRPGEEAKQESVEREGGRTQKNKRGSKAGEKCVLRGARKEGEGGEEGKEEGNKSGSRGVVTLRPLTASMPTRPSPRAKASFSSGCSVGSRGACAADPSSCSAK